MPILRGRETRYPLKQERRVSPSLFFSGEKTDTAKLVENTRHFKGRCKEETQPDQKLEQVRSVLVSRMSWGSLAVVLRDQKDDPAFEVHLDTRIATVHNRSEEGGPPENIAAFDSADWSGSDCYSRIHSNNSFLVTVPSGFWTCGKSSWGVLEGMSCFCIASWLVGTKRRRVPRNGPNTWILPQQISGPVWGLPPGKPG